MVPFASRYFMSGLLKIFPKSPETLAYCFIILTCICFSACSNQPWNNPYLAEESNRKIYYGAFTERPKHLDPAISYSNNEYVIIQQIYEPPLQYHYLKRPFELAPLTASDIPKAVYLDKQGKILPPDSPDNKIEETVYRIQIKPEIFYQPHPCFAKKEDGSFRYHKLDQEQLDAIQTLADFPKQSTRELTAHDYVYQIKRLAHPLIHSPILGLMSKHIIGLKDLSKELEKFQRTNEDGWIDLEKYELPGVRVLDKHTYEIRIRKKYPQFIYWLTMPFFSPIPREADQFFSQPGLKEKNITLDWYPIGTGPYMLTINNPNRQMVLEKNPNFHKDFYPNTGDPGDSAQGLLEDAGKLLPFIDKVVLSLEKEGIPHWNKFLQGYYDVSGISSDNFDQAVRFNTHGDIKLSPSMRSQGIQLETSVQPTIFYMGFNMLDPVVGGLDKRGKLLRQAISIAINYEEYISIFRNGRGIPAHCILPPGIFGFQSGPEGTNSFIYDWENNEPVRKSIKIAKNLLEKAGYPGGIDKVNGKPLTIFLDTMAAGPEAKATLDWYRKQFKKINIQLIERSTDYNRFQDKMRQGKAQLFQWGWHADYPDPENFLFLLYGPNGKVNYGGENAANYHNPRFDALFEKLHTLENTQERLVLIQRALRILQEDAPLVWGFHPTDFVLHHEWYKNSKLHPLSYGTIKYKKIDPAMRAAKRQEWNKPVIWPAVFFLVISILCLIPAIRKFRSKERETLR
ncbi:ABC transporter substrate-binding protein [Thermodesulfobacteriota bacterium]